MVSMTIRAVCLVLGLSVFTPAAQMRFTVSRDGDIFRLKDAQSGMTVSMVGPMCNAYEVRYSPHSPTASTSRRSMPTASATPST